MPTRPVTWELDVPPASLLQAAIKTSVPAEVPSIKQLRSSLMSSRFEMLKVSTFAACLLAFLGLAIHGSHLANVDNQFAANAESTLEPLANGLFSQAAALRSKTEALAAASLHDLRNFAAHASASNAENGLSSTIIKSKTPPDQQIKRAPLIPHLTRVAPAARTGGALSQRHLENAEAPETPATLKSLFTPDRMAAGIMGLVFYVLFAVVLIRKRGGLRAFADRQAI
jgi:hypothetical protein